MTRRRGAAEVTVKSRRATPLLRIDHHAWRTLSRKYRAYSKTRNLGCWLHEYGMCVYDGAPIDYGAIPGTRMAFETDHKVPRSVRPDLWLQWNNLRPSHVACNRSRQAKDVVPQGVWVRPSW